jgi:transposase
VGAAHNGKECADNCFAKYEYAIEGFGCFGACGQKFGRSLEYTAEEVAVIVGQTASAREARDYKQCSDNCRVEHRYNINGIMVCMNSCYNSYNQGRSL